MSTRGFAVDDAVGAAAVARYVHVARRSFLARSPMSRRARGQLEAAALGVAPRTQRRLARFFAVAAEAAARELLQEPAFVSALRRVPFAPGQRVVALGDSITEDACSWAEMLGAALRLTERDVVVLNHGTSSDTSAGAIERIDLVGMSRPDWVLQLLGTNDARRHGKSRVRMISAAESVRNFRALGRLITDDLGARLVRMTPTPLDEAGFTAWYPFVQAQIGWDPDDLADLARDLQKLDADTVDLSGLPLNVIGGPLLARDGVHPTVAGQKQILRTIVGALGAAPS